uniref:Uncharacterized protein n=1 Tax=Anguilla anguilla TaxID=7936 RepID=A0A0E9W429_ANGAN
MVDHSWRMVGAILDNHIYSASGTDLSWNWSSVLIPFFTDGS